jgi:hypothetical protein
VTDRKAAFRRYQKDIYAFSRDVVGVPLYAYQTGVAQNMLTAINEGSNQIITLEMPRQSGKNQLAAILQAAALAKHGNRDVMAVVASPTFKPQIVNSKMRFESIAKRIEQRLPFIRYRPSMGYIYKCGRAALLFFSAEPSASVVGATASLFMMLDECQDLNQSKIVKDFFPMRASVGGSPILAFGTTWDEASLLEIFKGDIQEGRTAGKVFRVLPDEVALSNPAYGAFVDAEVKRLGRDHPLVKTQYFLELLPNAGRMIKREVLRLMAGEHGRGERRQGERQIVAGLDFAGADEEAGDVAGLAERSARDSVALTVAAVDWVKIAEGVIVPFLRILARYEWVNINPVSLHTTLYEVLWQRWKVDRVHCDATGIGATATAFLASALNKGNAERVVGVTFDGALTAHTRLAFNYLATINGARLSDYAVDFDIIQVATNDAPDATDADRHAWWQRGHARLLAKAGQRVKAHVPSSEGHDDLLLSELLMVDAAYAAGAPQERRKAKSKEY